jgi:hypothetical protein
MDLLEPQQGFRLYFVYSQGLNWPRQAGLAKMISIS